MARPGSDVNRRGLASGAYGAGKEIPHAGQLQRVSDDAPPSDSLARLARGLRLTLTDDQLRKRVCRASVWHSAAICRRSRGWYRWMSAMAAWTR
jgi:hypothetical protein